MGVYYRTGSTSVYQLTDHLGNVRALVGKVAGNAVINGATDYYPFGMIMPNRSLSGAEGYRYAYQGQEKDPETGKEAFELRLWDSRIGRWLTVDPYGQYNSPYVGMGNDPINGVDPDGGYKKWFGAFFAWAGSGFKGRIIKSSDPATKWHKYGIDNSSIQDGVNVFSVNFGDISGNLKEVGGVINNQGAWYFAPQITATSGLVNFQFWRDRPADGFWGVMGRVGVDITYGTAENVYSIFSGKDFTGSVLEGNNAFEKKFDGFVTLATGGYSKAASGLKSVKSTLPAWNAYQTSTKGLYSGTGLHANSIKSMFYKEGIMIHNNMVKDVKRSEGVFDDFFYNINNLNSSINAVGND